MKTRFILLLIALIACSPTATKAQRPSCPRLIQEAQATDETSAPDVHVPSFATEEAFLGQMNATSDHRKVATILYHPGSSQGTFTLQMGTGHVVYAGSDLRKLTQQLNEVSKPTPGDTVYVNIDAPANRLEGLNRSLRLQQQQVDANIDVVPLGGGALDMETRELLFTHPVKEIKSSEVYNSTANPGWYERVIDFAVRVGNGIKTVKVVINARTRVILDNVWLALRTVFAQPSSMQARSVTELVSATRYRLKHQQGHVDQVDYLFAAQVGGSFMVSLPITSVPLG
jgi:hypothetical protein